MRSCQLNRINIAYNKFPGYTGVYCSSQPTQTSFPGSLIFPLPLRASKERPGWLGLVTCLPESGRVQLNYWQEGCPSRNFVYTEPMGERDVSSPKYHKLGTIWCSVRNIDKCHHTVGTPNVMAAVENWLLWGGGGGTIYGCNMTHLYANIFILMQQKQSQTKQPCTEWINLCHLLK